MTEPAAEKTAARDAARTARCALPPAERDAAAELIAARLLALPILDGVRIVLAYGASAEEVALDAAVAALRARGARIAYPRIEEEGALALHLIAEENELVAGPHGIREPAAGAPLVSAEEVEAVLVPGVAFDAHGTRVGFGGGYYDRLLPLLENAVRIGVAFDCQLVEGALPREEHDEPVDLVVTPTRTIPAE